MGRGKRAGQPREFTPISSVRDRPLPESLALSLTRPKQADIDLKIEALEALRGRFVNGYGSDGVCQGSRLLKKAIGIGMAGKWAACDENGPYGGAFLYLRDEHGYYKMPVSLQKLLSGSDTPSCSAEQVFKDVSYADDAREMSLGIKYDECNWYTAPDA